MRANGAKLWRLNYRYLEKYRTLAFGSWPEVSLADARSRRDEARRLLAAGLRWLLDKAYPKIGTRPIAKITAHEVLLVLRSIEATGRYESARRMRSVLGRIFRYAVATTRAERDPTGDLRGALTVPKSKHLAAITTPNRAGEAYR